MIGFTQNNRIFSNIAELNLGYDYFIMYLSDVAYEVLSFSISEIRNQKMFYSTLSITLL